MLSLLAPPIKLSKSMDNMHNMDNQWIICI